MDFFSASLAIKTVDVQQRKISGYAAAHHNIDRVRDIVDPQASVKAVARITDAKKDIPVFIGHQHADLPVGHPTLIQATPQGLYTETYVYKGPAGDNLLAVAKDMQDRGIPLGMSIGYKTHDSRHETTARGRVRRILDYELKEYSLAAHQTVANPLATVLDVKARRAKALSEGSDAGGGFVVPTDQKETDMEEPCAACKALGAHSPDCSCDGCDGTNDDDCDCVSLLDKAGPDDGGLGDEGMTTGGKRKTLSEQKAVWTTKYVNDLPNSSFLYVESGEDDGDGKRVPRSKRHFPYKDANGKVDLAHLRNAIARIPQSNAPGLDDAKKASLQARARRMLESADDGKTYEETPEWKSGAPIQVRALAYRLLDLSEQIATEQKAMALLGEDTKEFYRVRKPVRDELLLVSLGLKTLLEWCDTIERGADAEATITRYKAAAAIFDFV